MSDVLRLLLVWGALMGLLALTIGASFLPLGPVLPFISYGIAAAKTALVFWFFMEMRREDNLARLAALTGFVWLALLFVLISADVVTRTT
ncbi:cytochrome C oxidase subunit IV family protein [Novosphingobium sp. PY1]|uniref:cytochrome C oxidase subunit IV family protein n=1 Tax=Novosphingobium sp. PY1 TaxID=1882221 RepID=UPI001A8D82DD|nr:cytochrome C oxidase subunit IV family protein [Novosphingobium sp. PY1]